MFAKSDGTIALILEKNCLLKLFAVSCNGVVQKNQQHTSKPT